MKQSLGICTESRGWSQGALRSKACVDLLGCLMIHLVLPCLMILTSRCGNAAAILTTSLTPLPPCYFQANEKPGSKPGLGRPGWQQGSVFSTLGKMQSPGGIQVSHSLAHACGSHGFPTSSKRENSLSWVHSRDCTGRMQCPAVIKNTFLLVHVAGAKGSVLWCWGRQGQ